MQAPQLQTQASKVAYESSKPRPPKQQQYTDDGLDDEEGQEEYGDVEDDNRSVVSVSIGPLQRQLTSHNVSDAQKEKALAGEGNKPFSTGEEEEIPNSSDDGRDCHSDSQQSFSTRQQYPSFGHEPNRTIRDGGMPSPWTSTPKSSSIDTRDWYRRPRASTLLSRYTANEQEQGLKKYIPSLPNVGAAFTSLLRGGEGHYGKEGTTPAFGTADTHPQSLSVASSSLHTSSPSANGSTVTTDLGNSKPLLLRRTTSDGSLYLNRALSRASSLGDDSRWVDVHAQVNSRMKAIKDSLVDSNLKLPRFPSFPNLADIEMRIPGVRSKRSDSVQGPIDPSVPGSGASTQQVKSSRDVLSPPPGMSKVNAKDHPNFVRALKGLSGDVVILGGYRGSVLRSAEPPNRQLWVPVKVGLNLRKVNLEVGLNTEDEECMTDSIVPSGMLKNIGPVDISRRLFKRLKQSKNAQEGRLRIWDFGYDWRLSPSILSRYLQEFLEGLPCNQDSALAHERGATVIAHSLGGLVTRHCINKHPKLVRGVVYAGVPQHCVNILGPLRNGDEVLLSSRVLTAQVNFTIRTSFALLPLDGKCFIDIDTGERYDVDFFDVKAWEEYRLSPCINRPFSVLEPSKGLVSSMTSVFRDLPKKRTSSPLGTNRSHLSPMIPPGKSDTVGSKDKRMSVADGGRPVHAVGPQMDIQAAQSISREDPEMNASTAVSIPKEAAVKYLARTLGDVKRFKQELAFRPTLKDRYPPAACIYGKSVPTVLGANVKGREGIKFADAYDNLAFASGDGVVLARAAQVPDGYKVVRGGVVSSDRGHIGLLGDLEAVGKCLLALEAAHRGVAKEKPAEEEAARQI